MVLTSTGANGSCCSGRLTFSVHFPSDAYVKPTNPQVRSIDPQIADKHLTFDGNDGRKRGVAASLEIVDRVIFVFHLISRR